MRLAYTVATPETRDESMPAFRGPLPEILAVLQAAGYQGVDLVMRDPARLDIPELERVISDSGLDLAAISTGPLAREDKLSLCAPTAAARRKAIDRILAIIDVAARFEAQVNIGAVRGQLGDPAEKQFARESLRLLDDYASREGVPLAIEPQCREVINWCNTAGETLAFLQSYTDTPRILFDLYHASLEEESVYAALIRAGGAVSYVHVADSNRMAPGCGEANLVEFLRVLDALGYSGWLTVECRQLPDSQSVARAAAQYLLPHLRQAAS